MTDALPEDFEAQAAGLPKVDSPDLRTYYANSVDVLSSVYDVVLTIGQMKGTRVGDISIEQQARVIMSPQHLKVLSRLLAERVEIYERAFGRIPELVAEENPTEPNEPPQPS